MRNIILGAVGIVWGGLLLLRLLLVGLQGSGAFYAGEVTAVIFGAVMFLAGIYYLVDGIRTVQADQKEAKMRHRKKRRREDRSLRDSDRG
jgi:predicted transporter